MLSDITVGVDMLQQNLAASKADLLASRADSTRLRQQLATLKQDSTHVSSAMAKAEALPQTGAELTPASSQPSFSSTGTMLVIPYHKPC